MRIACLATGVLALLCGCASPPLSLYTLSDTNTAVSAPPLGSQPPLIDVARVTVPDDLDNEDILVRDGHVLRRSAKGRLASRLSLEVTDLLTHELAARHPEVVVTNLRQPGVAVERVQIAISQFDIAADGHASLIADWVVIPQDEKAPVVRDRAQFSMNAAVATDQDVVAVETALVRQLADRVRLVLF